MRFKAIRSRTLLQNWSIGCLIRRITASVGGAIGWTLRGTVMGSAGFLTIKRNHTRGVIATG